MTETTLEEARRCPKCQEPGLFISKNAAPKGEGITRGAELHTFNCDNSRCKWYGQVCRVIQVNPDGSIPTPEKRRLKHFPAVPDLTDVVRARIDRQIGLELGGGAEVNRG